MVAPMIVAGLIAAGTAIATNKNGGGYNSQTDSNLNPDQNAFLKQLLAGNSAQGPNATNIRDLSIDGLDKATQDAVTNRTRVGRESLGTASKAYSDFLTQDNSGRDAERTQFLEGQNEQATQAAIQSLGDVDTRFAGRGSQSSDSLRARSQVRSDLSQSIARNTTEASLRFREQDAAQRMAALSGLSQTGVAQGQLGGQETNALTTLLQTGINRDIGTANATSTAQNSYSNYISQLLKGTQETTVTEDPGTSILGKLTGGLT